jgi:hypothetical protein
MVDFLIEGGADLSIRDCKVESTADHWADFGGHKDIGEYPRQPPTIFRSFSALNSLRSSSSSASQAVNTDFLTNVV